MSLLQPKPVWRTINKLPRGSYLYETSGASSENLWECCAKLRSVPFPQKISIKTPNTRTQSWFLHNLKQWRLNRVYLSTKVWWKTKKNEKKNPVFSRQVLFQLKGRIYRGCKHRFFDPFCFISEDFLINSGLLRIRKLKTKGELCWFNNNDIRICVFLPLSLWDFESKRSLEISESFVPTSRVIGASTKNLGSKGFFIVNIPLRCLPWDTASASGALPSPSELALSLREQ